MVIFNTAKSVRKKMKRNEMVCGHFASRLRVERGSCKKEIEE